MYNLYIYEKQKRDEENRKNSLIKSQELSRKRKLQVEDLSSNYRERVKNFISDVTTFLSYHQLLNHHIDDITRASNSFQRRQSNRQFT